MPRHVLTLNDLGEEGSWLLVQQARGIPDAKGRTDFMTERTAVLLFAQDSFAERLCVSAAVRQMGGSIVFQGATGGWKSEVERYQRQMLAVIDYFVDCMYVYGIPGLATKVDRDLVQFPIINAGSPDAHPAHVLADVACMGLVPSSTRAFGAAWASRASSTFHCCDISSSRPERQPA